METCLLGLILELLRALEPRMGLVDLEACLIGFVLVMVSTLRLDINLSSTIEIKFIECMLYWH